MVLPPHTGGEMGLSYPIFRLPNYPQATGTRPCAVIRGALGDTARAWVFRSVLSASIDAAFCLEFYESPYNSSSWQSTLDQWCFKLKIKIGRASCRERSA